MRIAAVELGEQLGVLQAAVDGYGAIGLGAAQFAAADYLAVEFERGGGIEAGAALEIVPGQAQ